MGQPIWTESLILMNRESDEEKGEETEYDMGGSGFDSDRIER